MADINEILGRQINSVKELKSAIKDLQDSLVGLDAESDEFKTTSQQLAAAQDELTKVTRAGKDENIAAKDSIAGMEKEYRNLYNTYKMLSEEQRNSDFGKNMASSLETLSNKLNDSKKEVGNFKDNIGRYSESVVDAFNKMGISLGGLKGPLQVASNGTKGLNTAFKALAANPLMLALTALVAIFIKVADAIKKNEELTDRLKQALSVFQPVLNAISNAFDFLAGILVKVVEGVAKVGEKVLGIIPGFKKATKETQALAKAQDDLNKKQREASVENSKKQAEVARLREEASATEDVMEKKRLLEEAKEKQREIDDENIRLAQEELDILQRQSQLTANSAADNDALAAAQKKVNDAVAQGSANMRQYNKELGKVDNQVQKTTGGGGGKSKAQQEREEVEKLYQETVEYYKTEEEKLTEKYNRERKLMEKYHKDTTNLTRKYNEDIAALDKERNEKAAALSAEAYSDYQTIIRNAYENAWGKDAWYEDTIDSLNSLRGELNKLGNEAGDDIKEVVKFVQTYADITKLADYDYIGAALKNSGIMKSEEREKLLKEYEKYGEEAWVKLVTPIQEQAKKIKGFFGVDFLSGADLHPLVEKLGEERAEDFVNGLINGFEKKKAAKKGSIIELYFGDLDEGSFIGSLDGVIGTAVRYLENVSEENAGLFGRLFEWRMDKTKEETLKGEAQLLRQEIETLSQIDLMDFSGTTEERRALIERYYNAVNELAERQQSLQELQIQRTMEAFESLTDLSDRLSSSISTYRSAQEQLIDSEVKAGKIEKTEADKKKKRLLQLQKIERDFSIATIAADAAAGIFSVWRGYATEVGVINPEMAAATGGFSLKFLNAMSLVSALSKTAGLAATAWAQISAAKSGYVTAENNLKAETSGGGSGSGSGSGVAASPVLIDSSPYTYTRTFQTEQEEEMNNRPVWVSVVDVENALGQQAVVKQESSW